MKRCGVPLCLLLLASSSSAGEPGFQFSRQIITPNLTQVELVAVPLDSAVYEATADGLPDMRLRDGQGGAVPYLVRQAESTRAVVRQKVWTARRPEARPLEGGGLEITFHLADEDPQPKGLTIVTELRNFEQRVRVFSSAIGDLWEPLGEETLIFDYSRYMDVRKDQVPLPDTTHRRFRIVIDDITAEQESELLSLTRQLQGQEETGREERVTILRRPFHIQRIDLWGLVREERSVKKKSEYPLSDMTVQQQPERQQTVIEVKSGREPLTSIELQTPARNFSRRAAVEVEEKHGVQSSWRTIGSGTLSRIDFKSLQQENLEIAFPESRRESYRFVIDNRDSPPLKVTGLKAEGNVYEVVFLASRDTGYRLVYGSPDAGPPQYDTAAITQVLGEGFQPTQAELGPLTPAQGQPAAFRWADLLNNRPLLFSVIALLVVLLGWGLYHAIQRVDNLPSE